MNEWSDLFVATASSAAALTGFIFVGVSNSLTKILSIPTLPGRAFLSLVPLLTILVLSVLFLTPKQSYNARGLEGLLVGLSIWIAITGIDRKIFRNKEHAFRRHAL